MVLSFYPLSRWAIRLLIFVSLSAWGGYLQAQTSGVVTTQRFTYTGQIVTWTVPTGITSLTVEARGAEGGNAPGSTLPAGKGAIISGTVAVTPGQLLSILVGGQPAQFNNGGGGSFVVTTGNAPLVIAGGGGGSGFNNDSEQKHGQAATSGGAGAGDGGAGGVDGQGGKSIPFNAVRYGAGGGLRTDGEGDGNRGGKAFVNGGAGGFNGLGGFGGGGLGTGTSNGGGGGGYSGGGVGGATGVFGVGGGGGSFTAGTRLVALSGSTDGNSGNGLVTIIYTLPTIRYVKQGGSGTGDGTSWADASGDLQSQIIAPGVEQVWVAAGTYKPTTGTNRNSSFFMKEAVGIYGGFAGNETALSQRPTINPVAGQPSSTTLSGDIGTLGDNSDNTYHVISNNRNYGVNLTSRAVLDGFVVTGGGIDAQGGGIFNVGSSPTITNCSLVGNGGRQGGGMYNRSCSPTLTNLWFGTNVAISEGGALFNSSSNPVVTSCSFQNNRAGSFGGAIYNVQSSPSLTNCKLQANLAALGGGIAILGNSNATLTNCSLQSNTATNAGGVFFVDNSRPVLTNCSMQGNLTFNGNGDVLVAQNGGRLVFTNCVVYGNGRGNTFGAFVEANYCLFENTVTNYSVNPTNRTTTVSPFVSTGSVALNACAPAIDAGSNEAYIMAGGPATDLAGNPRIFGDVIDMGAVEFQGTSNQPVAITQQPASGTSVCVGSTVTVSVSASGSGPTYQWYKNGSPLTNNASAISATLTLTNVQAGDAGSYSVVVSSSCPGSVTSSAFNLTVTTPPTPTLLTQTGQSYPGGQSNVTVDVNSGPVNLVVGNCQGGTISWSGPNNSPGSSSPIVVSTDRVGQFVYMATCTVNGCTSPAASATVTVGVRLTVLHRDVDNYADNNAVQPVLHLLNQGTGAIPLSALTLRYYLTVENFMPLTNLFIYNAPMGAQNVKLRYVPLDQPRQGALGYVEYSFTPAAGNLAPNTNLGPIQSYFAKSDYGGLNELDDYSRATVRDQLLANPRITAYYNGMLVWGQEPTLVTPQRQLRVLTESKNGPSATAITTNLLLRNEGNLPVDFSQLRIRYYFTGDNQAGLTFYSDFRYQGQGSLNGQLVRLNPPLANADTYLEITPSFGGQLMPLSSLGVIRYSIYSPQGARLNQTNDYSYQERPEEFSPNSRVVVYVGGERVWGQEPGASARIGSAEPGTDLQVTVLENPVRGSVLSVQIKGAGGESLRLQLVSAQGRVIDRQQVVSPQAVEQRDLSLGGQGPGVYLLQVSTPTQSRTIRVLKAE